MTSFPVLRELPAEPAVTVILPAFNAAGYVADAVSSVRRSTYAHWRCVVVDDGSTDRSLAVARAAAADDARFVFTAQANGGHIAALNHAARWVTGDIVAFLDNDDTFLPDKLGRVVSTFRQRPASGLVTHRLYVTDERLAVIGVTPLTDRLVDGDLRPQMRRQAAGDPRLGVTSGMALRREIFEMIFPADPAIERFPDELIRRIAPLAAEVASCDEPLGIRRTHGRNQSDEAGDELADYVRRSLASYRLIRACQVRVASQLGIELPASDLDLDLMQATLDRIERSDDAPRRRASVLASPHFRELPALRRIYWRIALSAPHRALPAMLSQLYGVSNLTLLLNRHRMRRLRRSGDVPRAAPGGELPMWDVARRALPFSRGTRTPTARTPAAG